MFQSQMSQLKEELNQMRLILSSRPENSVPFTHSPAPMQQSTRGSCIVGQSEQPCDLYVEDGDKVVQLVAKGIVHNLGSTVHHQQMTDDEVRVSVEKVIVDAPLPLPTDELKRVSDAKGTFTSWPVKLVNVSTAPQASIPPPKSPPPPQAPPSTAELTGIEKISVMMKSGLLKDKSVPFNEVVGVPHPMPVPLDTSDFESLLVPQQELSDAIIRIFMK